MKKLISGFAALGLLTSSAFAQGSEPPVEDVTNGYYIFKYEGADADNALTPFGDYIMGYVYPKEGDNTDCLSLPALNNESDSNGPIVFVDGVAKLISAVLPVGATCYPGAFIGVEQTTGNTGNISDCTGGFSYYYKSNNVHDFLLEFDESYCGVTDAQGSNKWGVTKIAVASEWTKKTVNINELVVTNTWGGSAPCANATLVDLSKVSQLSWGFDNNNTSEEGDDTGLTKELNFEIANIVCLGGGNLSSSSGGGSSSSNTTDQSSSSGGGGGSSSSGGSGGGSSSSATNDPSSSSNGTNPIILLPQVAYSNALNAMNNGINLAATKDAVVKVFDIKGNAVRTYNFASGSYNVSFSDLPRGLYIVKASSASWNKTITVPVK